MDKVILSVAPVCATPHRIDPEELANEIYECYKRLQKHDCLIVDANSGEVKTIFI